MRQLQDKLVKNGLGGGNALGDGNDLKVIQRGLYPIPLIQTPWGVRHFVQADQTASGQLYRPIEQHLSQHVYPYYSNTHSNAMGGQMMTQLLQRSKDLIRRSINGTGDDLIIFTGNGCSEAIVQLIHVMNLAQSSPERTTVMISVMEHHSNYLPWQHLPVNLIVLSITELGLINLKEMEQQLRRVNKSSQIIVSLNATSNVTGVHQHLREVSRLVHQYQGVIIYDLAAGAPYIPIQMHYEDDPMASIDALVVSPHKFLGGPGTPGLLVANRRLFVNPIPFRPSGGTVRFVCTGQIEYTSDIEKRESGGTPDIIGGIRLGLAWELKDQYQSLISRIEPELIQYLDHELSTIPGLHLLNPINNTHRFAVYSFVVEKMHYNYVVVLLNDLFGIQTRGGVSCCSIFAQYLLHIEPKRRQCIMKNIIDGRGVPVDYGWCRVSFNWYYPRFLIEYIVKAIRYVVVYGSEFASFYEYHPKDNHWVHRQGTAIPMTIPTHISSGLKFTRQLTLDYLDKVEELRLSLISA